MSCKYNAQFNPLTTKDTFWPHQTWAACYQLAQSILKIGWGRTGGGGWVHPS